MCSVVVEGTMTTIDESFVWKQTNPGIDRSIAWDQFRLLFICTEFCTFEKYYGLFKISKQLSQECSSRFLNQSSIFGILKRFYSSGTGALMPSIVGSLLEHVWFKFIFFSRLICIFNSARMSFHLICVWNRHEYRD